MIGPNNIWIVENVPKLPNKQEALNTCLIRGWVEIIDNAVPTGELNEDTFTHPESTFSHYSAIYRITDSGWAVINRTHSWVLATFSISLLALISSIIQLWKN
ncbi:hypothetical protein [Acinetobacter sp. HR7]|uniref:hypothetical protein n=1 Tax=Acinetobacter sp. HR7 TaxID=1509403 RepID=UPI00126A2C42|nr:hypothetical protein [Acinetobacter sp. HR7]